MEYLDSYKKELSGLSKEELIKRRLYLKSFSEGKVSGPATGLATIDEPWLKYFSRENLVKEMPKELMVDYMIQCNMKNKFSVALEYFGRKITFMELFRKIQEVSCNFASIGVKKGDVVTLCMPSTPEAVYSLYALNRIGAVVDLVDPRYSADMIRDIVNESKSKYLVNIDLCNGLVKSIIDETSLEKVISVSALNSVPIVGVFKKSKVEEDDKWINWSSFRKNKKSFEKNVYEEGRVSFIVHSGGTTGKPKAIMLTDDNVNSVVFQYMNGDIELSRKQKFLDIIPPFAAYGLCSSIHMPLVLGMKTILIPKFDPNKFDELILKYKPTHVLGVPSFWKSLAKNPSMEGKDLSFLSSPGSGGDKITEVEEEKINEFLMEHNCKSKLIKGYGMSEVSSSACTCTTNANELTSVGIPLIATNIGVFEPGSERELTYMNEGEICICGPGVMRGYYNDELLTEKTIKKHVDGSSWVHTGDLGYITPDGILYVTGRIKRMIVRYDGFKMYPTTVEEVIVRVDGVDASAVVCSQNELGNVLKAYVVVSDNVRDEDKLKEKIYQVCKENLAQRSIPEEIEFIDELPLTGMGKVDYKELDRMENEKLTLKLK